MVMKKKIFMHVGPHKTGTTTIQFSMNLNKNLLKKNGIYYPKSGFVSEGLPGHHNLAWELSGNDRYAEKYGTWSDLVSELNRVNFDRIILSSEDLCTLPREKVIQINEYLKDFDVHIVIYVRRQDQRLQSAWSEKIKNAKDDTEWLSFPEFVARVDYKFPYYDYYTLIQKWSDVFGKPKIIVRVLEKNQLRGTLFNDFLTACEVPNPEQYQDADDMNLSPGIKTIVINRELKQRLHGKLDKGAMLRFYFSIREYADLAGWNRDKWSFIDKELHQKIMEMYRSSNQKIAREFFGRDELFLEPFEEKNLSNFTANDFSRTELLHAFAFITSAMLSAKQDQELVRENILLRKEIESIYASKKWKLLVKLALARKKYLNR